jgi:fatty acid synthase subunit alpha, fungi type
LSAELGELPEGSEDLTLDALSERLSSGFPGLPGKPMGKLLERMFTAKMPAGFNRDEARTHLRSRWGLDGNRQTAVLCFAVTMEPAARLSDAEQARAFLDSVVARYTVHAGISLQMHSNHASSQQQRGGTIQVDAVALDALREEQNKFLRQQFEILTRHLGIDTQPASADKTNTETQKELTGCHEELDEFLTGTQGIFDARKQRRYGSWWNWVREDIARLLHTKKSQASIHPDQLQALVNRWTPAVEAMLRRCAAEETGPTQELASSLWEYLSQAQGRAPVFRYSQPAMAPCTEIDKQGQSRYRELFRYTSKLGPSSTKADYCDIVGQDGYVNLRRRRNGSWTIDAQLTGIFIRTLSAGTTSGLSFAGKTALVTGAGPGSIGAEVVRGLLSGGARVIVTTSRAPSSAAPFFQKMYKESGGQGSELILLPFNAASKKDCEDLVAHIYDEGKNGHNADLDFVVPFAAIPEAGRELDGIDARSELAHRAMLVNVLRLLGHIKQAKQQRRCTGRPAVVILPLSPNHGDFGGDGLYSESKIGLETLFNRFHSEDWSSFLSVTGAVIGWTRGTGLMSANNIVAAGIEELRVLTFSPTEMAFNVLALLSPSMVAMADEGPLYADLSGGLQGFDGLKDKLTRIRRDIASKQQIRQALVAERQSHEESLHGPQLSPKNFNGPRLSNIRQGFPRLSKHSEMKVGLQDLTGMVDLSRVIVVAGFSELGPWGSSRTRWQMESTGKLTHDGLTELSWAMGLIKHVDGVVHGEPYVGWVDKKTGEMVQEADFASRYYKHIMKHTGIRAIIPDALNSYDPGKKEFMHEVVVDEHLPPFETSKSLAQSFKLRHGDKVTIKPKDNGSDTWIVMIGPGATFLVPKTIPSHQTVAARPPDGWDPATYGIPEDIVTQVDPITLYVLCCVSEAFFSAGIENPHELWEYMHVSELANCLGTGAGGLQAMRAMYRHRFMDDKPVQSDIFQETFLNSMAAWTNMLILGAAGPIKTPSGTCATAVESLDTACEAILSGHAKAAIVGGVDDFGEEASHEFSNMKATSHAEEETAKGRLPSEMSRPTATSRAGFMEAAGCGVQIVMSAELALEMNVPIHGVIAYSQLAGDGVGRSIPAPGQGVLTAAREASAAARSPLLDLHYRRERLDEQLAEIRVWRQAKLAEGIEVQVVEATAARRIRDAQYMLSSNMRQLDPSLSPMRAALSAWGLTIDDIRVASMHGTSTKANDVNESDVINQQMIHLNRQPGNPLFVICQKYLTGHPKGAAGAWMLNGCLQVLETGLVPGNRNADDVDSKLKGFEHLLYPSGPIQTAAGVIKACMLTSFGFGQKGGIVLIVSPRLLFAALEPERYESYRDQVERREKRADRAFRLAMMHHAVFKAKERPPWAASGQDTATVFLNPEARVQL